MQLTLLEILACPSCHGELAFTSLSSGGNGDVLEGRLDCVPCSKAFPIEAGIPRFVERENYASSFGYQWNRFKAEQIDSLNGTRLSEKRFYSETNWSREWMRNKWILDAGCGAGRFLDIASKSDCQVVGMDISNATDAAQATLGNRRNVHLVQASIYELPFKQGAFDGCYCLGVIQHTPDPERALKALPRVVKQGGRLAVTIYERKPWTLLNTKYLIRPLTRRVNQKVLHQIIQGLMPFLFPVTELLFRIPYLGRVFAFTIPVANYVNESELNIRQRYRWAILDTFDMLAPRYDQPQTELAVRKAFATAGIVDIERHQGPGLNVAGRKA